MKSAELVSRSLTSAGFGNDSEKPARAVHSVAAHQSDLADFAVRNAVMKLYECCANGGT